jgi:hypothetical protein
MRKKAQEQFIADAAEVSFMEQPPNAAVVRDFVARLQREKKRDEAIVAALERNGEIPTPAAIEQLRRYALVRMTFMKEVPLLRSSEVAQLSGSTARNSSARASRWKSERRIFSVQWNGIDYYPAFQFSPKSGEPLPAVQTILDIFGGELRDWQIAIWFFANNGSLAGGRRPMDAIARDPKAVIEAAKHEVEPFSG